MFSHTVTFTNLVGIKRTIELFFKLSLTELLEFDARFPNGYDAEIDKIRSSDDRLGLIRVSEQMVALAFGTISEDGDRFIKSEESRTNFIQSVAYEKFLIWLLKSPDNWNRFTEEILPDLTEVADAYGLNMEEIKHMDENTLKEVIEKARGERQHELTSGKG